MRVCACECARVRVMPIESIIMYCPPPTAHPFTACQHTLHKVLPNTCSEHNAQADERTSYTMLNNQELFDGFMEEALSLNPGTRPREMKGHKQTDLWLNLTTATTLKRKPFAVCFAVKNASLPSCSSPGTLLFSHTKTYPLQGTHLLQYKLVCYCSRHRHVFIIHACRTCCSSKQCRCVSCCNKTQLYTTQVH